MRAIMVCVNFMSNSNASLPSLITPQPSYYKEIMFIPFRNFTLTEFSRWRKILKVAKKNNFLNIKFEDLIQIVYYQIAITNYRTALFLLETYKTDNIQAAFLKSKLAAIIVGSSLYLKDDLEFCLKNYEPSIQNVICLTSIGCFSKSKINNVLEKLGQIEIIIASKSNYYDSYFLPKIRNVIESIELEMKSTLPFNGRIKIPKLAIESTLEFALGGSKIALLDIIREVGIPHPSSSDIFILIRTNSQAISELFRTKILELDYRVIVLIFYTFQKHSQIEIDESPIELKNLIGLCVDQVYSYILNGGDHAGIITGYLYFFANTQMVFPSHYETICELALLNLYSNGFLTLLESRLCETVFMVMDMYCVYKKWKIDKNLDRVECYAPIIADLMENIFTCKEIYKPSACSRDENTNDRLIIFFQILNLFPFWWKSSICIIGLNLFDKYNQRRQQFFLDLLASGVYNNLDCVKPLEFNDVRTNLVQLVDNIHEDLFNLRKIYKRVFMDDVDPIKFFELDTKYQELKQIQLHVQFKSENIVSFVSNMMCVISETYEFGLKYVKLLRLHEKYQPNGKHYSDLEESFRSKVTTISKN